ncbi:hypothetical protein JOC36_001483 [Weissella uvarum]|uniref:hypothetical protein n=1 Tax=Weissella uvarum TaxID=1479233 RepID=UPI00195F7D97|nr:hypothetical protein [Weissella uvarum]MBM7617890.1 hypothetical protein [Weissella uvarum]MCM0596112.1 hypothetical protein [Weissella uvarum]
MTSAHDTKTLGSGVPKIWFLDYLFICYHPIVIKNLLGNQNNSDFVDESKSFKKVLVNYVDTPSRVFNDHHEVFMVGYTTKKRLCIDPKEPIENPLYQKMLCLNTYILDCLKRHESSLSPNSNFKIAKVGERIPDTEKLPDDLQTVQAYDFPYIEYLLTQHSVRWVVTNSDVLIGFKFDEVDSQKSANLDYWDYSQLSNFQQRFYSLSRTPTFLTESRISLIVLNETLVRFCNQYSRDPETKCDNATLALILQTLHNEVIDIYDNLQNSQYSYISEIIDDLSKFSPNSSERIIKRKIRHTLTHNDRWNNNEPVAQNMAFEFINHANTSFQTTLSFN